MPAFRKNDVYAGRYQLEELIGEGGFSEVWKAKDEMADDSIVALKIYAPEKGLDEYGIKQFRKEYSITYNLSHPNLMKVLHFDICDGSPYLVMPYYKMGSLATNLERNGVLQEKQIALLMQQMGSALEELHSQEPAILHQDIKPDNILVRNDNWFILTDFGISSKTRHTINKATASLNSLTLAYSPPEKFGRNPGSTPASDIFSFGVTLYEMCTGNIPWEGSGGQSILRGAEIPDLPSKFPKELNKMIRSCMALNPEQRPTAKTLKNWGTFYLRNSHWKYEHGRAKKSMLPSFSTVFLVLLVMALLSLLFFKDFLRDKMDILLAGTSGKNSTAQTTVSPVIEDPTPVSTTVKSDVPSAETKVEKPKPKAKKKITKKAAPKKENLELKAEEETAYIPTEKPAQPEVKVKRSDLEIFLNQISDPEIPLEVRQELKKEILRSCSNDSIMVLDNNEGELKEYTILNFVDRLMNNPLDLKLEVLDAMEDEHRKYYEIHTSSKYLN